MTLECRAAIFLEENHISGDAMVEMDHSLDTLPDDAKGGCFYIIDLIADFVRKEVVDGIKRYYPAIAGRAIGLRKMADIATIEYKEKLIREAEFWENFAEEFYSFTGKDGEVKNDST